MHGERRGCNEEGVAVVQVRDNKFLDEHLGFPCEGGVNPPAVVMEESAGARY